MMDPTAFFAMVFGSEDFEPLVGALKMASMAAAASNEDVSSEEEAFKQRRREVQVAVNLRNMLAPCCDDEHADEAHFEASMREKAAQLAVNPFGEELLHVIGYVYKTAGEKHFGRRQPLGLQGHVVSLRQKGHVLSNQAKVVGSGAAAWWSQRAVSKESSKRDKAKAATKADLLVQKQRQRAIARAAQAAQGHTDRSAAPTPEQQLKDEAEDEAAAEKEAEDAVAAEFDHQLNESSSGSGGGTVNNSSGGGGDKQAKFMVQMLETLWHMSVLDIEATLRAATHKVLHDKPSHLSKEAIAALQLRRAKALLIVGRVFSTFELAEDPATAAAAGGGAAASGESGASEAAGGGASGSSSSGNGGSTSTPLGHSGGFKEFTERIQRNFGGMPPAEEKKKKKTWRDHLAEQVNQGSHAPAQHQEQQQGGNGAPGGGAPPNSNAADL